MHGVHVDAPDPLVVAIEAFEFEIPLRVRRDTGK